MEALFLILTGFITSIRTRPWRSIRLWYSAKRIKDSLALGCGSRTAISANESPNSTGN